MIKPKLRKGLTIIILSTLFIAGGCKKEDKKPITNSNGSSGSPNGPTVGANEVYNPTTGRIWMDRNLGASKVASSSTDVAAYGDLYQWGREKDGHEKRNSETTLVISDDDTPNHDKFIITQSHSDWRNSDETESWQGVNGKNNPCPSGYRIPTTEELEAEMDSWTSKDAEGAFGSPLKLPMSGFRSHVDGELHEGDIGRYWSSEGSFSTARNLEFGSYTANVGGIGVAHGNCVRCIKDE